MSCNICGSPDYLRCECEAQQPFCDQCADENNCVTKMDAQCVIYHLDNTTTSQLTNLGISNGASVEEILEAIDDLIGSNFNIPFEPVNSRSIEWTPGGPAGHKPEADVILSPDAGQIIVERVNGLFAENDHKVKVDATDTPDFLENQITGGSSPSGEITNTVVNDSGLLRVIPSIDILILLNRIRNEFPVEFCALFNDVCAVLGWLAADLICVIEDFETVVVNSGNDLPEPTYSFIDNDTVYFVSQANSVGKVWTIDPYTYLNNTQIVYVNETRSGQPYGVSGGTYVSGAPYRGNAGAIYSEPSNTYGAYYDVATRTLFIHGNKTYGCDYYDFASNIWDKVTINGAVTSSYNTTVSADAFTHTYMGSNSGTNIIVTGWGTGAGDRGTKVIIIDKVLREVMVERDTIASPIAGFSSNPFNNVWLADISPTNKIIAAKGQSTYRDVAIVNADLTFNQELVLPTSTIGLYGLGGQYVQGFFYDFVNDKVYLNDIGTRKIYVYSKVGLSYVLTKTFNLDNNRTFVNASVTFAVNPITSELFLDILYGDNIAAYNPDGIDDALESDRVSYKINRTTLEIERIYIGQVKASLLKVFANEDVILSTRGNHNPTVPTSDGTFSLETLSGTVINTGFVHPETLQEVNLNNNVPTGNTKPNIISDLDFIPDYQDLVLCPVTYNLNCPSGLVMTASTTDATVEFGLGVQVVNNPVLSKVRAVFDVLGVQKGLVEWNIPNTPNPNAFFVTTPLTGVSPGDTVDVSIYYINSSNAIIGSCIDIASYVV